MTPSHDEHKSQISPKMRQNYRFSSAFAKSCLEAELLVRLGWGPPCYCLRTDHR